jgi:hypothetical protein
VGVSKAAQNRFVPLLGFRPTRDNIGVGAAGDPGFGRDHLCVERLEGWND